MATCTELLTDYRKLVEKVDTLCEHIAREYAADIACRKGCSSCCQPISIFWVEAVNLALALSTMPRDEAARIRSRATAAKDQDVCPLLLEDICQLYLHRPIICRTHGLPIIVGRDGAKTVDFCPRNFQEVETLRGNVLIDLERLNAMLAAVNALFVKQYFQDAPPTAERITIYEALFLEVKPQQPPCA